MKIYYFLIIFKTYALQCSDLESNRIYEFRGVTINIGSILIHSKPSNYLKIIHFEHSSIIINRTQYDLIKCLHISTPREVVKYLLIYNKNGSENSIEINGL